VSRHVFGDRGLRDLDAQLEELAMNPRSAPERIGQAHPAHEGSDLRVERGPSRAVASTLPAPVVFEPLSVPADDRFGLDNHQRSFPATPSAAQHGPEGSIEVGKRGPPVLSGEENRELLA